MVVYIVYDGDDSDKRSAELIAECKGFELLKTLEDVDPSVYSAKHDDNDIVCVGGGAANAYSAYYFPRIRYDSLLNPKNFPENPELWRVVGEFGITPDGKRIIHTIRRANGTTVTIVAGVHEEDTWKAANDYCLPALPVVGVVLPLSGIIPAEIVWVLRGKKW